jgi:uncharacterized protein YkwD
MPVVAAGRSPRRIIARTVAYGLGALAAAALLAWTPTVASGWNQGSAEATLWQLLNGARVNNGMAPLQQHGTLVSLARWRSSDMLNRNYFSHTIPGCNCLVYAYYDSNGLRYDWAGENIGWNAGLSDADSPVSVHEKFMASPGHRANVLTASFTHGGVGAAAADGINYLGYGTMNVRMYTELFLDAPSAAAPPPPPPSGGGSGGGGGSTTAARPAAPAAAAAPEPKAVEVDAPRRPVSSAGIDGVATPIAAEARTSVAAHVARVTIDELGTGPNRSDGAPKSLVVVLERAPLEVSAAAPAEAGMIDSLIGAILGFLFG